MDAYSLPVFSEIHFLFTEILKSIIQGVCEVYIRNKTVCPLSGITCPFSYKILRTRLLR